MESFLIIHGSFYYKKTQPNEDILLIWLATTLHTFATYLLIPILPVQFSHPFVGDKRC